LSNKPTGLNAAKKLRMRRRKFLYCKKDLKRMKTGSYKKSDPFEGAPLAKAIVLSKGEIEVKQPHSGLRKIIKAQLVKNGRMVTAYGGVRPGSIKKIDEHNTVILEKMGAPQKRAFGDMPGIKYRVLMVNGVALEEIRTGRKEKPVR
jgi:small subunit ribosomal protein S12